MTEGADRPVRCRTVDGVAMILLDHGPANALDSRLRGALGQAVVAADLDPRAQAIVLTASGTRFSSGADIRDFATGTDGPSLAEVALRIEQCATPVIAALPGPALGGGAELALACHYRLGARSARIGFPEVSLGLLPQAGGSQRLTRLAGAATALEMLLGGASLSAETAQIDGLVDGIVSGDVPSAGLAYARNLIAKGEGPRPTGRRREGLAAASDNLAMIRAAREAIAADPRAVLPDIVACVEAALLLPFSQGLAFEAEAYCRAERHPQSRALRHVFLAERRAGPEVILRDDQGRRRVTAGARQVAERLLEAMTRAAHLLAAECGEVAVDGALVAEGFDEGPFGGNAAAAAPAIWRKLVAAAAAEAARLIVAGQVRSAADVDVAAIHAGGFPRLTGGPCWVAQALGLAGLADDMAVWGATDPVWQVPEPLRQAANRGRWA